MKLDRSEGDSAGMLDLPKLQELRRGDEVTTPGVDGMEEEPPPWLDKEKFYRARDVYRKHFASINLGHLCGLLLSFYFSKNVLTLKSTGSSNTLGALFHRYLATIRHVQSWYEGDVWDVQNPARKSLTAVRTMHSKVANKLAERKDGVVYISQWDMTLTQWAFIGPIVLFPTKIGFHGCSEEDFEILIYFWRCIGHLLGVEDQFNLCCGSYSDVVSSCHTLLMEEYRVKVEKADSISVSMGKAVVTALRKMDNSYTWGSMAMYIHLLVGLTCPITLTLMDWLCFWAMYVSMVYAMRFPPFRILANYTVRGKLDKASNKTGLTQNRDGNLVARVTTG